MAQLMPFAHPPTRALGDKLQIIAATSPADLRAIDILASFVLDRLEHQKEIHDDD